MKNPDLTTLQEQCDRFNAQYRIGDTIKDRRGEQRTIRFEAQVLGGHTPVVYVTGGGGCIALSHVAQ